MKVITKTADRLVSLVLPKATASAANVRLFCACIKGVEWFKLCEVVNLDMLKCGGCNVKSTTKC